MIMRMIMVRKRVPVVTGSSSGESPGSRGSAMEPVVPARDRRGHEAPEQDEEHSGGDAEQEVAQIPRAGEQLVQRLPHESEQRDSHENRQRATSDQSGGTPPRGERAAGRIRHGVHCEGKTYATANIGTGRVPVNPAAGTLTAGPLAVAGPGMQY